MLATAESTFIAKRARATHRGPLSDWRVNPTRATQTDQDGRQLQSDSLTRCLGLYPHVQVDTFDFELAAGDTFILATRGIWGALNGLRLADVLETKGYPDAPSTLVSLRDARNAKKMHRLSSHGHRFTR